jgi:hypothetical protein
MEGEIGTRTTYDSNVHFIRPFSGGGKNEEMNQEAKTYAKLQLSNKRYTKEKCVKCGLAQSGSGYAEEADCSSNAKELPSSANNVEHSHLKSKYRHLKNDCSTLNVVTSTYVLT